MNTTLGDGTAVRPTTHPPEPTRVASRPRTPLTARLALRLGMALIIWSRRTARTARAVGTARAAETERLLRRRRLAEELQREQDAARLRHASLTSPLR